MITQAPRGVQDWYGEEMHKRTLVEKIARYLAKTYHSSEIITPMFEHTVLFQRGVGETTDVVQKEMYTFMDKGNRSITLRPEGTAGTVRSYIENKLFAKTIQPQKLYYVGPMFRYERPQNGRQRQFHQFGVEMIGYESPYLDVECMTMAVTLVEALGLKGVKLHINTLGDEQSREAYRNALKEHFAPYLDELCSAFDTER